MTQPTSLKTFLWFQNDLEEALNFYKATFKDVVGSVTSNDEDSTLGFRGVIYFTTFWWTIYSRHITTFWWTIYSRHITTFWWTILGSNQ